MQKRGETNVYLSFIAVLVSLEADGCPPESTVVSGYLSEDEAWIPLGKLPAMKMKELPHLLRYDDNAHNEIWRREDTKKERDGMSTKNEEYKVTYF